MPPMFSHFFHMFYTISQILINIFPTLLHIVDMVSPLFHDFPEVITIFPSFSQPFSKDPTASSAPFLAAPHSASRPCCAPRPRPRGAAGRAATAAAGALWRRRRNRRGGFATWGNLWKGWKMMRKWGENHGTVMGKWGEHDGKTMVKTMVKTCNTWETHGDKRLRNWGWNHKLEKSSKKAGKRRRIQQKSGKMQGTGRLNPPQIINRLVKHGG